MKKCIYSILQLLPLVVYPQSYQTVESAEERGRAEYGVYYKDINSVFNGYEGTYEYTGPGFYFKIVLVKMFSNVSNYFYEDTLAGTYQYVHNGIDKNYLDDSLYGLANDAGLRIKLGSIRQPLPSFCLECLPEKYLTGAIFDRENDKVSSLYVAKKVHNGEEGIQLWFLLHLESPSHEESEQPINLPIGEFFMKKIN
jgi:hypothetical protein